MLTWRIWISCPQLPPASFLRARLRRPIPHPPRLAANSSLGGVLLDVVTVRQGVAPDTITRRTSDAVA